MKKKILLRTCMLALTFLVLNQPAKAQECNSWEVWSCYYYSWTPSWHNEVVSEACLCVDASSPFAQQCAVGLVLACRENKCEWECKCIKLSEVEKWTTRGSPCNQGGHNGGNYPPHWNWRSGEDQESVEYPSSFSGLYPNPVSDFSTISFSLSTPQITRIKLFDLNGLQVALLADQLFGVGDHEVVWNVEEVPAGLYIMQLQSKELLHTETVVVMK